MEHFHLERSPLTIIICSTPKTYIMIHIMYMRVCRRENIIRLCYVKSWTVERKFRNSMSEKYWGISIWSLQSYGINNKIKIKPFLPLTSVLIFLDLFYMQELSLKKRTNVKKANFFFIYFFCYSKKKLHSKLEWTDGNLQGDDDKSSIIEYKSF